MVTAIVEALEGYRFNFGNEDELQAGLAGALRNAGYEVEREVRLDGRSRIDLLVEGVGIEVKVKGKAADVLSQCERYAAQDRIEALVLVTTSARHRLPHSINGKPVRVVSLGAGRL